MKKSELKTGMRVETRAGEIYLVIKDISNRFSGHQDMAFVKNDGFLSGTSYTDDLIMIKNEDMPYDIVKVYGVNGLDDGFYLRSDMLNLENKYLIWERPILIKNVTMAEIEAKFGCKVNIMEK